MSGTTKVGKEVGQTRGTRSRDRQQIVHSPNHGIEVHLTTANAGVRQQRIST